MTIEVKIKARTTPNVMKIGLNAATLDSDSKFCMMFMA
jgi:hypothetical protein